MTQRRTDRAERLIAASPERLYAALTDGDAVAAWLPPEGMRGRIIAFDPVPGGRFAIALTYRHREDRPVGKSDADTDVADGRFVALEPGCRVVQATRFESDDPDLAGEMILTWSLDPRGEATLVTIAAADVPPGIGAADHAEGLASSLANLAAFVEAQS